jgi:DNA-binding MarR family transcriptional regulator
MGDTSWHMLLALTADDVEGKAPSVTSLCVDSGSPPTTALRHIAALERLGLIRRTPDMFDARRYLIQLTPEGRTKMREAVMSFCVPAPAPAVHSLIRA